MGELACLYLVVVLGVLINHTRPHSRPYPQKNLIEMFFVVAVGVKLFQVLFIENCVCKSHSLEVIDQSNPFDGEMRLESLACLGRPIEVLNRNKVALDYDTRNGDTAKLDILRLNLSVLKKGAQTLF